MARGRACVFALVALAAASTARAQPREQAEARERFFAGAELYQEGRYEAALAEFEESRRLRPAPVVTFNIAQTLRELERYHEAVLAFRRYLQEATDLSERQRREVELTIEGLERRIATVTLRVEPAGAEIVVDGRRYGTAPLAGPIMLGAGRRILEIRADGHLPLREELHVVGRRDRELTVRLAVRETAGTVRVTAEPADAAVRIDGLDVGTSPVERVLPGGGHVISASLEGHEDYRASIELADRQTLDLHLVLDPERPRRLIDRWWFWTSIGAAALGLAIMAGVLAGANEPDPVPGNSFPDVIEL